MEVFGFQVKSPIIKFPTDPNSAHYTLKVFKDHIIYYFIKYSAKIYVFLFDNKIGFDVSCLCKFKIAALNTIYCNVL